MRPSKCIRAAVAAAAAVLLASAGGCREGGDQRPVSRTQLLLGTNSTIIVHGGDPGDEVFDRAFARVREIQDLMSLQYKDSELNEVNRKTGVEPVHVSEETFHVVETALEYAERTHGTFNVALGPIIKAWGISGDNPRRPPNEEIEELLTLIDYREVELDYDARSVFLRKEGMVLDLGGIAKGYAADEAARVLVEHGVEHALVDFGGDIRAVGRRPDGERWRIGIQDPADPSRGVFVGVLSLEQPSVVTSGDYERFLEIEDESFHHIIDPDTGFPAQAGLRSVTIETGNTMLADIHSTAVFVLGLERGLSYIEAQNGVEAILVTDDDEVHITDGLRSTFELREDSRYRLAERP